MKRFVVLDKQGGYVRWGGRRYGASWPWLVCWLCLLLWVGSQFLPLLTAEIVISLISGLLLAGIILWQQWQLVALKRRLHRLERVLMHGSTTSRSPKPMAIDSADRLLDEFFGGKKTKH